MRLCQKPQNNWGWIRLSSGIILIGVTIWTVVAVVCKSLQIPGRIFQNFTLLDGFELGIVLGLAMLFASWMEDQDAKTAQEEARHQETEQILSERRKVILGRFQAEVTALSVPSGTPTPNMSAQNRRQLSAIIQSTLPELDGHGRGELLAFLHEKQLLATEAPLDLHWADCRGAILTRRHLEGICLENVDLCRAHLESAHLAGSRLCGANLGRARLRHASLSGAILTGCNLRGANLENANLEGADFTGACLEDAFLKKADLRRSLGLCGPVDPPADPATDPAPHSCSRSG